MLYMILITLLFGAGGLTLFFMMLRSEAFGPAGLKRRDTAKPVIPPAE